MTAKEAAAILLIIKMEEIELTADEIREFSSHFQRGHFTDNKVDDTFCQFDKLWERAIRPVWNYIEQRKLEKTVETWTTGDNRPTLVPTETKKEESAPKIDWSNF